MTVIFFEVIKKGNRNSEEINTLAKKSYFLLQSGMDTCKIFGLSDNILLKVNYKEINKGKWIFIKRLTEKINSTIIDYC